MNSSTKCWRLGITGGIGSGKTTVCKIFETLGIPVYYADYWAKWLTVNDLEVKNKIIALLGDEAYLADGNYNRAFVSTEVFQNPEKLLGLNKIIHPAVAEHGAAWQDIEAKKGVTFTIKEAALLIESGSYKALDKLIVVSAPEELRIKRVMARDKVTEEMVVQRIRAQIPESEKLKLADYIILNDGNSPLIPQVMKIYHEIKELNKSGD